MKISASPMFGVGHSEPQAPDGRQTDTLPSITQPAITITTSALRHLPAHLGERWSHLALRQAGLLHDRCDAMAKRWGRGVVGLPQLREGGNPGNQGISVGYADTYFKFLGGQYFCLMAATEQAPIPPGQYNHPHHRHPPFTAAAAEPCPHTDLSGFCHQLPESNFTNTWPRC